MKRIENECCDCGLSCIYESCKYYKVVRYYCDSCEKEEELYYYENKELCADCILNSLEKVGD